MKEFGFMSIRTWSLLSDAYKNKFDNELVLRLNKQTYSEIEQETDSYDVIPF